MSEREWKPGDVAHLTFKDGTTAIGVRQVGSGAWGHSGEWAGGACFDRIGGFEARPLVVIDPEDRVQVGRLWDEIIGVAGIGDMQDALREFANPTPPKPDEPTGLGAVVEDVKGDLWVRVDMDEDFPWTCHSDDTAPYFNWHEIKAVHIHTKGKVA